MYCTNIKVDISCIKKDNKIPISPVAVLVRATEYQEEQTIACCCHEGDKVLFCLPFWSTLITQLIKLWEDKASEQGTESVQGQEEQTRMIMRATKDLDIINSIKLPESTDHFFLPPNQQH